MMLLLELDMRFRELVAAIESFQERGVRYRLSCVLCDIVTDPDQP